MRAKGLTVSASDNQMAEQLIRKMNDDRLGAKQWDQELSFLYAQVISSIRDTGQAPRLEAMFSTWLDNTGLNLEEHMARVELLDEHRDVQVIYFMVPQLVKRAWDCTEARQVRDDIKFPKGIVRRDNPEEKVLAFLQEADVLVDVLRHRDDIARLSTNFRPHNIHALFGLVKSYIATYSGLLQRASTYVNLGVQIILLVYVYYDYTQMRLSARLESRVKILEVANVVLVAALFAAHWVIWGELHVQNGHRDNPEQIVTVPLWLSMLGKGEVKVPRVVLSTYYFWRQFTPWYHAIYLGTQLYAFFSRAALWYAFGVVDIVRQSRTQRYVVRSVTKSIHQVFYTAVLGGITLYLFATACFALDDLRNQYSINDQMDCTSLRSCFITHLSYGFMEVISWNGDEEVITPAKGEPFTVQRPATLGQAIYGVLFTFLVNIIAPSVITGIIIDTFSAMRENNNEILEDLTERCFICNIEREEFEKLSIDFESHIKHDHNMWMYVWFLIYLREKGERGDSSEFTGQEIYAAQMLLKNQDISCMPIKKAKVIQGNVKIRQNLPGLFEKVSLLHELQAELTEQVRRSLSAQAVGKGREKAEVTGLAAIEARLEALEAHLDTALKGIKNHLKSD
ncbi:unnamed protein product [Chrysoparadoxa australica]